ncbi:MAG: hypothetical protein IIY46_02365, partial [Lachnospiraceae bacterium]|nr:hypothetical protein [Lachnospiraceae bacterium]
PLIDFCDSEQKENASGESSQKRDQLFVIQLFHGSELHTALAFLMPLFQELDNGVLHLLGGVGLRKILPELFTLESDTFQITFFDFTQDLTHVIQSTPAFLAKLFQALCLGERGCSLLSCSSRSSTYGSLKDGRCDSAHRR